MLDGIIVVNKEAGFTSNDVVAKMRGICRQKKVGHTGTLDPDATGVLPVCLGSGTKLCDMLAERDKEYVAELLLGVSTDTQDLSGTVLSERPVEVTEEAAREALMSFVGPYDQVPPMYSALKVNGKKLYELAREGKEVERKARRVEILELEIIEMKLPVIKFRVVCTKGTYIRTLCADAGEKLGCGAAMKSLRRTRVGRFTLAQALTLGELQEIRDKAVQELDEENAAITYDRVMLEQGLASVLIPTEKAFEECRRLQVLPDADRLLRNGNPILPGMIMPGTAKKECNAGMAGVDQAKKAGRSSKKDGERVRMCASDGTFLGLYEYDGRAGKYQPVKMFL